MRRRTRLATLCAAVLLAGTACSSEEFTGVYDLPLPGGADLGTNPYRVTVEFADVLDLVPQAAVKVNDVPVGRVESIDLAADGWTALTVITVNGDVVLPADSVARLRQSSLLGEKFVELAPPGEGGHPPATQTGSPDGSRLAEGAVITAERTDRSPEFEEVFGALSLLLNGGGIGQLQTISQEMSQVFDGNEEQIRGFLNNVDELVANLDAHRGDITAALDGLNTLSATLTRREGQVRGALNDLAPGLRTLSDQRTALVTMLRSLDGLSTIAVDTITKSRADLVADLEALSPILGRLADASQDLPKALEILPTFPFTDQVLQGVRGDYLNAYVSVIPAPGVEIPPPLDPQQQPILPLPSTGPVTTLSPPDGGDR